MFHGSDFFLVAREIFHGGESLCSRWRFPRSVLKKVNGYTYIVEDLRNGIMSEVNSNRLRLYADYKLSTESMLSYVIKSETRMQFQSFLWILDTEDGLKVVICWLCLPPSGDTEDPMNIVNLDDPGLFQELLERKSTQPALAEKAFLQLNL